MFWIAIECPHLPLDLLGRGLPDAQQQPLVVHDDDARRPSVIAATAAAQRFGVQAGMPLAAAQSLADGLRCHARRPDDEAAALERLATCCYRYSSWVSLAAARPENGWHCPAILIEAGASERLFGPPKALADRIRHMLDRQGWRTRTGGAPVPDAARLAAARGQWFPAGRPLAAALADTPVAQLPLDTASLVTLHGAGLKTLGAVLRLPRKALTRRLGPTALQAIERLLGTRADPPTPFHPADSFTSALELPMETRQVRGLLFPLKRLVAELAATLIARDAAVASLTLHFDGEDGQRQSLTVSPAQPLREAPRLLELISERLHRLTLERPVRRIAVQAEQLLPHAEQQPGLFGPAPGESADISRLRDRLEARLGREAIRCLGGDGDHRPERRGLELPIDQPRPAAPQPARPSWLMSPPQPCDIGDYRILAGPERIETGWWDGEDCRRDYYVVADSAGSLLWAYRAYKPTPGWFLHGVFG